MTIRNFHMNSAAANVSAAGTIDLPGEKLNLQITIALANLTPICPWTWAGPSTNPRPGCA